MKCIHCQNELPNVRGWATDKNPHGKLACMKEGCISYGINYRSKQFQTLVMGKHADAVEADWKNRITKGVRTKRKEGLLDDKSRNPYSIEFWIARGLSQEEARDKLSIKNKKSSATKRRSGYYNLTSNNPYSIDFWVAKGFTHAEAKKIISSKNHNCPEFWQKKGYTCQDAILRAKESADTNSFKAKVKKYGEDAAPAKYLETRQKLANSWSPSSRKTQRFGTSHQANRFIRNIYKFCRRLGYARSDIMCASNKGELYLRNNEEIYFYDFCIKPLKIVIEFNGEHVHPNRGALDEQQWNAWRHAFSKKTADEVVTLDTKKISTATKQGYNVLTVWSKDATSIQQSKAFIGEHHERQGHPSKHQR